MNPDRPMAGAPGVVPARGSRLRIKSLMIWVGVIAAGLGWVLHTERTRRALQADQATFASWIAELQAVHPALKSLGSSSKGSWNFFEMERRCTYEFSGPAGRAIVIQADLRSGPFHTKRLVSFESPGRTVTWPFEDVERGRTIDLKAEFPGALR